MLLPVHYVQGRNNMTLREMIHLDRPFHIPVLGGNGMSRSLSSFQNEMNRLFHDFFGDTGSWLAAPAGEWEVGPAMPAIDVTENDKSFTVKAEMPGMDPEKIEVSMSGGYLTIKGERRQEKEEEKENYLRHEISYGACQRTVLLPEAASREKAEASFKNGILTVSVPKKAEAIEKPRKIEVKRAA